MAAGFVLAVLAAGCLLLWVGVPLGALWLASTLTDSFGAHVPVALALIVPGVIVVGAALAWVNDLYLRITGGAVVESAGRPVRRRGPLEPMLAICFAVGLLAFVLWFLLLAENPRLGIY